MDMLTAIEIHARFLSDPALDGRAPGTEGHEKARRYLLEKIEHLGLQPLYDGSPRSPIVHRGKTIGENLGGCHRGKGNSWILFGAHYDHLRGIPGADDNAAALAILLAAADRIVRREFESSIAFAFFDLEEPPYYKSHVMGSVRFAEDPPFPLDELKCAVILDLCGHDVPIPHISDGLFVLGTEYSTDLVGMVRASEPGDGLKIFFGRNEWIDDLSDQYAFRVKRCPFLFLSCGWWEHYHEVTDTFEKLNLEKMARVSDFLVRLAGTIDGNDVRIDNCPGFVEVEADSLSRILGQPVRPDPGEVERAARVLHGLLR